MSARLSDTQNALRGFFNLWQVFYDACNVMEHSRFSLFGIAVANSLPDQTMFCQRFGGTAREAQDSAARIDQLHDLPSVGEEPGDPIGPCFFLVTSPPKKSKGGA